MPTCQVSLFLSGRLSQEELSGLPVPSACRNWIQRSVSWYHVSQATDVADLEGAVRPKGDLHCLLGTVEKNAALVGRHVHDTELHFRTRVVWPAGSVRRLLHLGTSQATNWVSILVNMAAGLIHRRLKATCPTGVPCFLARREVLGSPSGSPFRMKIETP